MRWFILAGLLLVACLIAFALYRGPLRSGPHAAGAGKSNHESAGEAEQPGSQSREVTAAWYDVPTESLAHRRAGLEELTAAHDKLPLGTLLRVTRLESGKSVQVRITDRGIHNRKVQLDLCKEAAEELGMVSAGVARVRIEVIPGIGPSPSTSSVANAQP